EERGSVQAKLELDRDRGGSVQDEHRLVCRDGSVKWVSLKAQRLREDDGNQYFYGVFVDITEVKQVQARVSELYE
ncbi:PAS domain S-box protein, partial [Extibacter muris]|uniref:PAS domain S-box protein n=1 Tax=Extibacter muris TaxID=1796622 RepID=UPI00210DCC92